MIEEDLRHDEVVQKFINEEVTGRCEREHVIDTTSITEEITKDIEHPGTAMRGLLSTVKPIDILVKNEEMHKIIEVKSEFSSGKLYRGIGQLFVYEWLYNLVHDVRTKKILVFGSGVYSPSFYGDLFEKLNIGVYHLPDKSFEREA